MKPDADHPKPTWASIMKAAMKVAMKAITKTVTKTVTKNVPQAATSSTSFMTFRNGLIVFLVCLLVFSSYKIIVYAVDLHDSRQTYADARAAYHLEENRIPPAPTPATDATFDAITSTDEPPHTITRGTYMTQTGAAMPPLVVQDKFKPLLKQNKDVVGWVSIEGTAIDYPVVQTSDNEFYLYKDLNRENNVAGSIFMDYRNQINAGNANLVLYGHSMKNGSMFGELLNYESKWNFENHAIIQFDTLYENHKWEIFSAYITDTNFDYIQTDFTSPSEYKAFLDTLKAKSLHPSDIELSADDVILTLSTCSYAFDDSRFAVHARLIE